MATIVVPKPKSIRDPNRLASSLLLAQVHHMREAEKNLPERYHSGIFHKSIVTEGEVARYVRAVTEAIHKAHTDAAKARAKAAVKPRTPRRGRLDELAAAADRTALGRRQLGKQRKAPHEGRT